MEEESYIGLKLLETIGECNSILAQLSKELQKQPEVKTTQSELECRTFPASGTLLSFYLDAELKNGNCVSYSLRLSWNENEWIVSPRISINDEQGYKVVKDFLDMKTENFRELLLLMVTAASELQNNSAITDLIN
jgi:hypothetical protein